MFIRFFALIFFFPLLAHSQAEIPFNGQKNSIEYKQAGNNFTWQPVTGETPRPAQAYRPDLSRGSVSTVEPKVKWTPELPYDHKGGPSAKAEIKWPVDPKKVSDAAAKAAKSAASGAATGNLYLAVSSVACAFVCEPLLNGLLDWGLSQLAKDEEGNLSVPEPDSSLTLSTGYLWSGLFDNKYIYPTPEAACKSGFPSYEFQPSYVSPNNATCFSAQAGGSLGTVFRQQSNCPSGHYLDQTAACFSPQDAPSTFTPLETYLQSNYTGKGWDHHWAGITAGLVAAGHNVFTDGTGTTISGPANVPLSQSTTQNPVNVLPSTTTPAPPGHTGPTDSGTITTTTTQTANNTFRPGSSSSGPSMQTSTQTSVSTSVTNNVTNNTSTSVVNQTTQTDEAPKEKDEDFCKKNPDSLACAELDTPEGEIPRDKIEIDFEPEDLGLGAGSCPPDKPIDDVHVFSYQPTCDILDTYGYWLTIALSTFGALLIIFVGKADA